MGKYLCIGGVNDGKYYEGEIGADRTIRLRQRAQLRVTSAFPPAPVEQVSLERYSLYRTWPFFDGISHGAHFLLVDESIEDSFVMTRLFEGYVQAAPARREGGDKGHVHAVP